MGEIHEALKRAQSEAQNARASEPEVPTPVSTQAPTVAEVAAAARGEVALEHSSAAPEIAAPAPHIESRERLSIPLDHNADWPARAVVASAPGGTAEAYRHFAIQVSRELDQRNARSVMVVSALRLEGKTTTACNLALAMASMSGGERVALVDFDLRRPSVARVFGARPQIGIDDVLRSRAKLAEACVPTDLPSLDLYPVATQMSDPHSQLSGPVLPALLAELHASYHRVVLDSPPVLLVPDAELIMPHVGGVVAILRAKQTTRRSFEGLIGRLPAGKLLGSFLNQAEAPRHAKQYGYYLEEESAPAGEEQR